MNKDRLNSINPETAMAAAYRAINTLQSSSPDVQVAAISMLFRAVSEYSGISVSELMHFAKLIHKDADTHYTSTARALDAYVKGEIN